MTAVLAARSAYALGTLHSSRLLIEESGRSRAKLGRLQPQDRNAFQRSKTLYQLILLRHDLRDPLD